MKRVFDTNPSLGITRYWHHETDTDTVQIETVQDVTDVVESNKSARNDASSGWKGDLHKVASIPMAVYYDLKSKGILDDEKALRAWLNDPDNRYFRTKPGRV